ncbi:MAG: 7TM diverse intracellular signaling domain-containing protein, partial [Rhodoferax sp.]
MVITLQLWDEADFHRFERDDYIVLTLFGSIILVLALYNLVLWVRLRDKLFLWYSFYALLMLASISMLNGMTEELLALNLPQLTDHGYLYGFILATTCFLRALRLMLHIRERLPSLFLLLNATAVCAMLSLPLLWFDFAWFAPLCIGGILLVEIGCLVLLAYIAYQKVLLARLMLPGYCLLLLGSQLDVLLAFDLVHENYFTSNGVLIGATLDMLFFANAVAFRFNLMRRERMATANTSLERERKLVEELHQHERGLEQEVNKRTLHLIDAQTELQAAKERAEEATRVKSEFLAIMSHEI